MKKILLSIAIFAGFTASAQSSYTATSVTYEFNGSDTANCGVVEAGVKDAQVPSSKYTNTASYTASFTGTALKVNKLAGTTGNAWHKLMILVPKESVDFPCAEDTTIDLGNTLNQQFNICVSTQDSIKQFVVILMDENENFADSEPWQGVIHPGDTCLSFSTPLIWGSVDSSKIAGIGLYFRNAYNDNTNTGVINIDKMTLGRDTIISVSSKEISVTGLNVYPNPATDQLNVVFDATSASKVYLSDLTGKLVDIQTANVGANTINFNVENVNAGVYFVNISNAFGNTARKVIIK